MNKKQIFTGGAASVALLASAALAFAQTATTTTPVPTPAATTTTTSTSSEQATTTTPTPTPAPSPAPTPIPVPPRKNVKNTVQIGPEGHALIRGTVNTVGTNSLTVNSWGGVWTINVSADTQIMPKSTSTALMWIKPGDFVGVNGKVDTAQPWTVNARVLRDTDAEHALVVMQKQIRAQMKEQQEKARQAMQQAKKTAQEQLKQLRQRQEEERKKLQETRKHNRENKDQNGQ